jgi:hypothetical protein
VSLHPMKGYKLDSKGVHAIKRKIKVRIVS